VADFETSRYDETGIQRKNFALSAAFGVKATDKLQGPRRWDFMQPAAESNLLEGVKREFIPSPIYYVPVTAAGGNVILKYTAPLAGRYDGVPKLSNDPSLVVNHVGKGKVVYFSGDMGNTITKFHTPELMDLVANAGLEAVKSFITIDNAPGSVELVVRTQEDGKRTLVHFVNFTGAMTRPIRQIVPIHEVGVTVAPEVHASRAYTLWDHRSITLNHTSSGKLHAIIPELNEYEVLVLER